MRYFMTRNKSIPLMATTIAVMGLLHTSMPAQARGAQKNVDRINNIINELTPAKRERYRRKNYRKHINKIILHKRHRQKRRSIMVNYNHSVDLSVYFYKNSIRVTPRARDILNDLGYALSSRRLRNRSFLIAGHTDSSGSADYNQWLSEMRAHAVKRYLLQNFPIDRDRIVVVGFGEDRLADRRHPRSAINRRVEVSLIEDEYSYAPGSVYMLPQYHYKPSRKYSRRNERKRTKPCRDRLLSGSAPVDLDDYTSSNPATCLEDAERENVTRKRKSVMQDHTRRNNSDVISEQNSIIQE